MKDKLPAVLWYASDWLGSNTRARMTHQQRDVYLTLLFRSWYEEPMATLPNDDALLAMMGGIDLPTWTNIKTPIMENFVLHGTGRIYNPRMFKEAQKARGRQRAGQMGGKQTQSKPSSKIGAK
jgi:uncharacterized protein YdaU (DUF1376 family)